jgi:broad specificity phosphatase PhoE
VVTGAAARVTLLAHAPTAATAAAAFPDREPLDDRGRVWAERGRGRLPRAGRVRCAPEPACVETSALLGLSAEPDAVLGGWDLGRWAGRTLDDVAAGSPGAVTAWLTDPDAVPHGGESLSALVDRVRLWLANAPGGHTLAVCGPDVVRAAVVAVLGAPPTAFWRLDVAPMTVTDLRGGPDRWTVRAAAAPVAAEPA